MYLEQRRPVGRTAASTNHRDCRHGVLPVTTPHTPRLQGNGGYCHGNRAQCRIALSVAGVLISSLYSCVSLYFHLSLLFPPPSQRTVILMNTFVWKERPTEKYHHWAKKKVVDSTLFYKDRFFSFCNIDDNIFSFFFFCFFILYSLP